MVTVPLYHACQFLVAVGKIEITLLVVVIEVFDGVLITSGIIAERHQDVVEALAKEGFYPVGTVERKGWVAITLKKAGKE